MAFDGFRKIRCPFCANEYRLGEFAIYSEATGTITKEAPKTPFQRVMAGVRFPTLQGKENVLARRLRQCPNCAGLLPLNIEYVDDNITIAVIGDSFSGKSHFIAAAIQQLKERRVPAEIGLLGFSPASSKIEDKYRTYYYDPLFKHNVPIEGTRPALKPVDEPLMYEMRFANKRINLLMYDASGEDIALIDTRVPNKPHILNAQAMIFLADPWSMPGFLNQLAHHLRPDATLITGRIASDILTNVMAVFQRASNHLGDSHFSLPIAVAISKSDLIPYLITRSGDPRYKALLDPQFPSSLTRDESNAIHQIVRQLLLEVGQQSLVAMEDILDRIHFSAFTATGGSATQGKYLQQIMPHRCLDPLFWVLRELNVIP